MKRTTIAMLALLVAVCLPLAAVAQISSAGNGSWTEGTTWVGGVAPTSADDVLIAAGDTISVDDETAVVRSITFGGDDAQIDLNPNSLLTVYGDFTIFSTTHTAFSAGWSATNAFMKFAGSAVQTLSGFRTDGGSTSLRDVIVDKDGGLLTTSGVGMRLGIQNSLEIVNGLFELAPGDDLEGRWASSGNFRGDNLPNITIRSGGEFKLIDGAGAHHIRSDYVDGQHVAIGKVTVYGSATFRDGSTYKISLNGVDIEPGGKVITSLGMGGGEFDCGPMHIMDGGELENYTTSDCWGTTAVVTLDRGGLFDTKSSTTLFPPAFVNHGTVRYSRDATTDQAIVDMDYSSLEISLDSDNNKNWVMAGDFVVSDTLKVNYSANLVLTAALPQTLTVGNLLYLTSGQLDNSDANVSLTMADGTLIQRATGTLARTPVLAGMVNLRYTSTSAQVTTGPEMPVAVDVIDNVTVSGTQGVVLGTDITVGGTCTTSGSNLITGDYGVTLGPLAALAEADSATVLGTVMASRTVAQASNEIFGGIGLELNAATAAPGLTQVTRTTGVALDIDGTAGIERYFDVAAANNTGLDATVVIHYAESELNGLTESLLGIHLTADGGASWTGPFGSVDVDANTVAVTGLASLVRVTVGQGNASPVGDPDTPARTAFVAQYPNPFNPMTKIAFELAETGNVQIGIYNVRGELVAPLASGVMTGGRHELTWQGVDGSGQAVASGVYFCRLVAGSDSRTLKMVLAR